ncbi:MAG: hypothetical protein LBC80_08040 [Treponema sp.]|jgi:hypothetical protein|nr:hypothetical protein [Treponema sp.]
MRKKRLIILITASLIFLLTLVLVIVFNLRSPVLIVAEQAFVGFYGEKRIRKETLFASITLFRPVKNIFVANDAGDDIVSLAVSENSSEPFCVIFPLRFVRAAQVFQRQNPQVPVVILQGRFLENQNLALSSVYRNNSDFLFYKTDITSDFYRAGLAAAAFDNGKNGTIMIFVCPDIDSSVRNDFIQGVKDYEHRPKSSGRAQANDDEMEIIGRNTRTHPNTVFFTSFSQFVEVSDLSCVVIIGAGTEYMEKKTDVPVILFTWLDPSLVPDNVVLVVNDSSWAQVVHIVRLWGSEEALGFIPSKFHFINTKNIDRRVLRKIQKTW